MVLRNRKEKQKTQDRREGEGIPIVIKGTYHLKEKYYEITAEELDRLRRENPLRAAVYLAKDGKVDEAESLVEEAHRRLKEDVTRAMEEKYQTERADLEDRLKSKGEQRELDQQQLATFQQVLQSLSIPPLSRAVLLDCFEILLTPDQQITQLKVAIAALEALRPNLDSTTVDMVLSLLHGKLAELEEASSGDQTLTQSPPEKPTQETTEEKKEVPVAACRAVIAEGPGRYEVSIATQEPLPDLESLRGREVWTKGDVRTVVKIGDSYPTGVAAEVVKRLDDERLHVKGRADEEFVVQMTPELAAVEELEAGDLVRILPQAELGLGLLEKATKRLALDELPTERYEDIGGLDEQIAEIKRAIELPFMYRTVYRRYDLRRPKGILLYGPPGCGKTMIAKAIARSLYDQTEMALEQLQLALTLWTGLEKGGTVAEAMARTQTSIVGDGDKAEEVELVLPKELPLTSDTSIEEAKEVIETFLDERQIKVEKAEEELRRIRNRLQEGAGSFFLSIKGPELLSKWVGESEYSIRRIFATAREKATQETPVILFFDEIESMFSRRGSGRSSDMEKTIVPQLLAEIDGIDALPNVLVIGASNRYDLIDPAVLRPGRLDIKIRIDRPNKLAASQIMAKYLTPNLPIEDEEIRLDGSKEQAIQSLISKTIDVIYNPGSQILIYRRTAEEGGKKTRGALRQRKALTEVVSGAMLANIVERAKRNAAERDVGGRGTGINWTEDLRPAIRQECEESKDQYIFEARGETHEMAYLDADLFEAEVILEEETKVGRPVARWVRFKTRPWFADHAS
jgi:SpoVK/Ycf46/Vps4 family AAA+-type ATPase